MMMELNDAWGRVNVSEAIVVCHSEPGAWHPPKYHTTRCPPRSEHTHTEGLHLFVSFLYVYNRHVRSEAMFVCDVCLCMCVV